MITLREEEWGSDCEYQVWGHISAVVKMFYLLIYIEVSSAVSFLLNSKLYTTFYVCVCKYIYICKMEHFKMKSNRDRIPLSSMTKLQYWAWPTVLNNYNTKENIP